MYKYRNYGVWDTDYFCTLKILNCILLYVLIRVSSNSLRVIGLTKNEIIHVLVGNDSTVKYD